jgi:uncharacterized membrane protein (UPF0182 family)
VRDKRGNGERDWGNIDWSNFDLSQLRTRRGAPRPPSRRNVLITLLAFLLLLVPLLLLPLNEFLTDLLWFRSLGLEDVYLRRYTAGFWAFVAFFLIFFALAVPNLYLALRPQVPRVVVDAERPRPSALAQTLRLLWVVTIPAFFFGLAGGDQWDQLLRWLNAVPFGLTDPLFQRDIGFYFFTLPVLDFARGWAIAAILVIAAGVVFLYAVRGVIGVATSSITRGDLGVAGRTALALARPARAHLSVLGGMFLLLVAFGYVLDQYDLLFRTERVLTGAGFASVNARIPALTILSVLVGIAALACFANAFARTLWVLGGSIVLWFAATVLINGVYPALIQNFVVAPDELNKERPYLERNIAGTRAAYALDKVEESLFNVQDTPSQAEARQEFSDTLSVRLWDYNRLLSAFDQLQALRQYYDFVDVDVDRYSIGGRELPVMLSGRELNTTTLPQSWVNRHLQFTHGFGAVMAPVGGLTPEGQPLLILKDIPPQGEPKIEQPRIYYGELTNDYVIVDTGMEEFDYPAEGQDARTRYSGAGGVGVSSLWDRILFTLRFGETNLLVSDQIRSQSRLLFHRNITERQQLIAPFLEYDRDPYLVVADGKLWWINDAYTVGNRYPYSERFETLVRGGTQVADGELNYIRNSVKVVTNAYDGSIAYYVIDETDPVVRTLRAIYPSLFTSLGDMPQSLKDHLRYPEDLFSIQTQVFAIYHMTDIDNFYNRADAWRIANKVLEQGQTKAPIEPYYVTTRLPGSDRKEFILFVPMTPAGGARDNMVAWIAGRADAPDYGKLRVLRFPQDRQIFGPLQIEGIIDSDATIKQQLTLLCPQGGGSTCFRGNLLVLPVGNSFLYVEGLFVQATQGRIPQLQRVILATQGRVVMAPTFEGALDQLFGQGTTPPPTQPPPTTPPTGALAELVRAANEHFQQAQTALRNGDFAEYGRLITLLQEDLARLRAATGQ